jgi:hypothetical protein
VENWRARGNEERSALTDGPVFHVREGILKEPDRRSNPGIAWEEDAKAGIELLSNLNLNA